MALYSHICQRIRPNHSVAIESYQQDLATVLLRPKFLRLPLIERQIQSCLRFGQNYSASCGLHIYGLTLQSYLQMRLVIFIIFAKSAPFYSIKNIVSRYPKNFENGALVLVGKTLFWLHPIGLIVLYVYDSNQPNN